MTAKGSSSKRRGWSDCVIGQSSPRCNSPPAEPGRRLGDFQYDGTQFVLWLQEKGDKSREIPVRHDLEGYIRAYLDTAGIAAEATDRPLFRSTLWRTGKLTGNPMTSKSICELVKRRLKDVGLPERLSPHSFRVTVVTDLLTQGVPLEDVQYLAGHSEPRTMALYDRRQKKVTRNIIERISSQGRHGLDHLYPSEN